MEPIQVNASEDFETSGKELKKFFEDNSAKLPEGIALTIMPSKGKIEISVWSYQTDPKHVEGAVRKMEKDFKLGAFGPLEKAGREGKFHASTKEMSVDEFASFLKAVNEKDSGKLIESVKNDYKAIEIERKNLQIVKELQEKFTDVQEEMKSFYPGNALFDSKAYGQLFFAKKDLEEYYSKTLGKEPGAKLDSILEKVKEAVKAFDEEAKKDPKNEKTAKVKMKLVGLQGTLENAMKTPVEGKGQPPKPVEPGKQAQPSRP